MEDKKLYGCQCKRCGKEWYAQTPDPVVCVKCHSPYWSRDKLRRNAKDNNVNDEKGNE